MEKQKKALAAIRNAVSLLAQSQNPIDQHVRYHLQEQDTALSSRIKEFELIANRDQAAKDKVEADAKAAEEKAAADAKAAAEAKAAATKGAATTSQILGQQ